MWFWDLGSFGSRVLNYNSNSVIVLFSKKKFELKKNSTIGSLRKYEFKIKITY